VSKRAVTVTKLDCNCQLGLSVYVLTHRDMREMGLEGQVDLVLVDESLQLPSIAPDGFARNIADRSLDRDPSQACRLIINDKPVERHSGRDLHR
jgi:hypothetical protein